MAQCETSTAPPVDPGQLLGEQIPSAVCSTGWRHPLITGMLVDHLRRHFASAEQIEDPTLKSLIFRAGDATGILIETTYKWNPRTTQRRAAVLVGRGAYQNMRRGTGDRLQGAPADRFGNQRYSTFWTGSHVVFCLSESGGAVDVLSSEVARYLVEFAPILQQKLNLLQIRVLQIGGVAKLEEHNEMFVVPIVVGVHYEENWVLRPQAPLLKKVVDDIVVRPWC